MARDFSKTKYGSYLIIPLKFDNEPDLHTLENVFEAHTVTTMDINPNIKALFHKDNIPNIGKCYHLKKEHLYNHLKAEDMTLLVCKDGNEYTWSIRDSFLYLFHTKVAFFCLGIEYDDLNALNTIINPGFAINTATFFCDHKQKQFSLSEILTSFLESFQLYQFFDNGSLLLDVYTYNLALFPERFNTLEEMEQLSFNLHQMIPLDIRMDDQSEQDISYVYAVRNYEHNSYRWGCCVTSQTISYVVADEEMDFDGEWNCQGDDGLPVVLLALYQKYTCLRFNQLISDVQRKGTKNIKPLKHLMLEFKAFGTVEPANLSRWDNVRQIYRYLMEVNGVSEAVSDIADKLNILVVHQEEMDQKRNNTVLNIITVFGIVSILASVLSIVQILSGADTLIWVITILTSMLLMGAVFVAFRFRN